MKEALKLALDLAIMHHSDDGYAELRSKVRQLAKEALAPTSTQCEVQPEQEPVAITVQQAHDIGAKGAEPTEAERLLFEAWMRGHCWALCARWTDGNYRSDAEQGGNVDPHAMRTRQLWAAWRDRAALTTPPQRPWVGLTDENFQAIKGSLFRQDLWDGYGWDLALKEAIEAKLKEKNT